MDADCANVAPFIPKFGQDGAAWLEPRKVRVVSRQNLDLVADQNGIAVPAQTVPAMVEGDMAQPVRLQQVRRECGWAMAQSHVGLLQHDDIGIESFDHTKRALGIAAPVGAKALADVVGGDA